MRGIPYTLTFALQLRKKARKPLIHWLSYIFCSTLRRGARCRWRSWLGHWAKSLKVAGSIPNGVVGILHWHNPSGRTITLESTQSLTEEYQEYLLGCKGGLCLGLTTLPPSCADCLGIWDPQPPGTLRACLGLSWDCFTFTSYCLTWTGWRTVEHVAYYLPVYDASLQHPGIRTESLSLRNKALTTYSWFRNFTSSSQEISNFSWPKCVIWAVGLKNMSGYTEESLKDLSAKVTEGVQLQT